MTDKQRDVETMAERWQRQKPTDFGNATDLMLRLGRIDDRCICKLVEVDGENSVVIIFSDGSIYVMGAGPFPIERFLSDADYATFVEAMKHIRVHADDADPAHRVAHDTFTGLFRAAVQQMVSSHRIPS
jgi:hypothetical protein